jgi:hypothetical protein
MMKKAMRLRLLIPALLACISVLYVRSRPAAEEKDRMASLEKALRECRVVSVKKDEPGRTSPWSITFAEGCAVKRALFRYVDRPRPQPMADSYKYDIAAYELTKLLEVDMIPPVVEREIEGRKGTLQVFLENCIREKDRKRKKLEPPNPTTFSNSLEEVKVLENLTYDECQDADDLYIHRDDWRVCRVDFSEAFAPVPELLPGCNITVCSRRFYEGLLKLDEGTVKSALERYLSIEEIGALLIRKGLLIEKIKALICDKGEDAVLF